MRIQHNILAMNAYRNYSNNTSALGKNLERLSSGYKINRAGDDAAGLAISEKMRAQITGLDAAQKNVKDGVSLVKTAEGAMQEIQDMLNRMAYLATQSANGTYDSSVDRTNLQKEVDALRSEINRIADSANFNGINLLDGSQAGVKAQAAYDEVINGASFSGEDRILKSNLTGKALVNNAIETVFDAYAKDGTVGSFEVDFSKIDFNITSTKSVGSADYNQSFAKGNWSMPDLKVTIGDLTFTVKADHFGSSVKIALGSNGEIKDLKAAQASLQAAIGSAVFTALKEKMGAASDASSVRVTLNGVDWIVKQDDKKLVFEQVNVPQNAAEAKMNFTVTVKQGSAGNAGAKKISIDMNGAMEDGVKVINEAIPTGARRRAETHFEIKESDIVDGAKIVLGDQTFIIKLGASSKVTANGSGENLIDMSNYEYGDLGLLDIALSKISAAASTVKLTNSAGEQATFALRVTDFGLAVVRQSMAGSTDTNLFKTWDDFLGNFGVEYDDVNIHHDEVYGKGGLMLQIGDTSDDYNQLRVNIGDMHVGAMGYELNSKGNITNHGMSIADIDISNQADAQTAVNVIKNAINYVSGIRGDLGAVQNRLEHTANNLSVMAENIQDAESTIRDTDVAEEMMSYVKNNILIQSAQAMLAQANQIPQGVLQLLG